MLETYEISKNTLAIIPIGNEKCRIVEEEKNYIVNKGTTKVIDDSCKYFGSSLQGRHDGTKNLLGINYKAPIIVEESSEIIFFPTNSPRINDCTWISLNNLEDYRKNKGKTKVIFKNGVEVDVDVSYNIIDNQVLRSTRLESILRKRKNF